MAQDIPPGFPAHTLPSRFLCFPGFLDNLKRAESIRPLFMPYARSVVQFLVSVIVVLGTEPLAQPFFHAAAAHAQIMPAADQQAYKGRKRQTGANDLHDHARSFAHRKILLFSDIFTVYGDMIHRLQ